MKRFWLISICLILALSAAGVVWLWLNLRSAPHDPQSATTALSQRLTRGYHTTALMRMLNDDQPESVLVVLQNDWELRPTGGFITAFGTGHIINGRLSNFSVVPSDFFDEHISLTPPMPAGLGYRISTPSLAMRDANWDVDFSTTAATLSRFYQDATDTTPDLVIALTTTAAEQVLAEIGPLTFTVNDHVLEVTSQTVTQTLEHYTDQAFRELGLEWETRKQVLSSFAAALLPQVEHWTVEHPFAMLRLANQLLARYDVQVWSPRSRIADHLQALGTSQEISPTTGHDMLLIVDANIGARKTNRVIDQRVDYRIDLSTQKPTATVYMTYVHTGSFEPTIIEYFDTVRVYAPFDSILTSYEGLHDVATVARHDRTVFEGRFVVAPGATQTVSFTYELPFRGLTLESYRLLLERQPGSASYPVQVTVSDGLHVATINTDNDSDHILKVEPNQ